MFSRVDHWWSTIWFTSDLVVIHTWDCISSGYAITCERLIMKLYSFGYKNVPFNRGDELYANDPAGLGSNPRISFHICQKIVAVAIQWTKSLKKRSVFKIKIPVLYQTGKNDVQLSEGLKIGIMGFQLRASTEISQISQHYGIKGSRGGLQQDLIMSGDASFLDGL